MKGVNFFLNLHINASIHVSLAVVSLLQISLIELHVSISNSIYYFVFFSTVFCYNSLKYLEVFVAKKFTFSNHIFISSVTIIAFLGSVFCFFLLPTVIQFGIFKISLCILLYPFLRKQGFLKIIIVAICVTYITLYIPMEFLNLNFAETVRFLFERFILVLTLLIPLEIFQIEQDSKTINTVPVIIGISKTKYLGYLLLLLYLVLNYNQDYFLISLVFTMIIASFIYLSDRIKEPFFYSFWLESIPIFWLLLLQIVLF
jgi:hypothetical protein